MLNTKNIKYIKRVYYAPITQKGIPFEITIEWYYQDELVDSWTITGNTKTPWGEWVDSEYNYDGFYVDNDKIACVFRGYPTVYLYDGDELVHPSNNMKQITYTLK